jgi:cytochrome P450
VLAKLRQELAALGTNPPVEALLKAPYLGAVCDETLRIRPVVTDTVRPLVRPMDIGGRTVPAGQAIVVLLQAILTDPAVFPEPERFRPERFLEQRYAASEFLPFGGGHRRCLGAAFAENEMRLVLGTLVAEWDLELTSRRPERAVRRNVTMGPERGVPVRFLRARA